MTSIENYNKAMLKLAQFRYLIVNNEKLAAKDLTFIFHGLDLNLKVSDTICLKEYNSELIGCTLLDLAHRNLNIDVFSNLIDRGVDFNVKNKNGNTVLHEIFYSYCNLLGFTTCDVEKEQLNLKRIPFIDSVLSAHIKYNNTSNPSDSIGLTHFHIACVINNIEAAKFFLNNGVSVDQALMKATSSEFFKEYTALHFAAEFGCLDVIKILLYHSADANLKDVKEKTPLHIALERNISMIDCAKEIYCLNLIVNNQKIIRLLVKHTSHTEQSTVLIESAIIILYSTRLLQVENINQCISMKSQVWPGYTPLHFAAHVKVNDVKGLACKGANIQAKDANGVTPFDLCVDRYNVEDLFAILHLEPKWSNILLSDGKTWLIDLVLALRDSEEIKKFLQRSDESTKLVVPADSSLWPDLTVLHVAVLLSERIKCKTDYTETEKHRIFSPDLTVITEILNRGADVTVKDQRNWTPVHLAFRLEKMKTLDLLLKHHTKITNVVDGENLTHLHIACAAGNKHLVQKLSSSTSVNIAYDGSRVSCVYPGWTPLHVAIYRNDIEITKLSLRFGAAVNSIYKWGSTPIHDSLPKEFSRVLFGEKGLRNLVVQDLELSYLHVACLSHNEAAVERLIQYGIDVNRVVSCKTEVGEGPHDGSTALHLALDNLSAGSPTRLRIASLLMKRGADLFIKNSKNISPWAMILEGGREEYLNVFWTALKSDEALRKSVEEETGLTLLHVLCRRMNRKSMSYELLISGADLNFKVDLQLIRELLKNGADANARITENSSIWPGFTPLHVLILSYDDSKGQQFQDTLVLLLSHEADVTLSNADKRTPLHMAYHRLHAESDEAMLNPANLMLKAQRNFEVNPTSPEGISHFHIACHTVDVETVENFLNFGQVDVNASIDVFCNFVYAASSPLLLATGKRCWKEVTLNESSSKLKIVDLLIKRGARVDLEDLEGNTAAHNATFCCFMRDNYLQRLANGGADMNAINTRGETPLELILNDRDPRKIVEGLRHFIACGCRFNAFKTSTEEGFVALAQSRLTHDHMRSLLIWTTVNCPDSMKNDDKNRTALHNLVSVTKSESSVMQYVELFDVLMESDCDIDDQDESGMTALHLAAQFRNEPTVEGLLLSGANVNIMDYSGKTPFDCVYEPCSRCTNPSENHTQYSHCDTLKIFATQIQRMQLCNLEVNESNERLLREFVRRFDPNSMDNHADFLSEIDEVRKLIIPYLLCVGDFISDTGAVIDYSSMSQVKRKVIRAFFRKSKRYFEQKFEKAAGILQLQYRQALLRRKIVEDAKDALSVVTGIRVPDICSHIIMRPLKNSELRNLILSKSLEEIANTDVDC